MARVKHTARLVEAADGEGVAEAEQMAGKQGTASEVPALIAEENTGAVGEEGVVPAASAVVIEVEGGLGSADAGDGDLLAEGAGDENEEGSL